MSNLPDPPVPASLDLRCFASMPLDVTRLRSSETWILANGAEAKAAMSLWAASWHQVPAGSVINDDRVLAHLSMAGAEWPNVKAMALRGWVLCADGRFYHPVICQLAVEADAQKKDHTKAKEKKREAMREWRERSRLRGDHVAPTEAERVARTDLIGTDVKGGKEESAAAKPFLKF
jgi:hypothetical protein